MRTPATQSSPSTGIARTPEQRDHGRQSSSFRDSLKRRDEARKSAAPSKARPARDPGLQARPDGMLVISAPMGPPVSHPDARRAAVPSRPVGQSRVAARRADPHAIAITDVKVGGTKDSAHVHARIGEGRHTGVELRAHEENGKISIELLVRDADAARALRGELADLRESLRARGLDAVNVEVRADVRDDRGARDEHRSQEDDAPRTGDAEASTSREAVAPVAGEADTIVL